MGVARGPRTNVAPVAIVWALRRLRAEPFIAGGALVTVTLALVLLASGPIFADAVSTGALRQSLRDAPSSDTAIDVTARVEVGLIDDVDAIVVGSVSRSAETVAPAVTRLITAAESFALPAQPAEERVDLARLVWVEAISDHATVEHGVWPSDAGSVDGAVPVAVDADAADALGLDVGHDLELTVRTGSTTNVAVRIVGTYRLDEPSGPFWHERDRVAESLTVTSSFRTVTFIVPRDVVVSGLSPRPELSWLALPTFDDIELDEVELLRGSTFALEADTNARLFDLGDEPSTVSVSTSLGEVLADSGRDLSVAQAVIIATILQLATLAAFALLLVGGLGVEARRAEATLIRARGAGAGQMTGEALVEAAIIVVPIAVIAPFLATGLVALFDNFEPLASIGFELETRVVSGAWLLSAAAAVITVGLLTWPTARAARVAAAEGAVSRQQSRGVLQRSGGDLAILAAAAFAYWQLRVLGDDRASAVSGRFGVDPMVIVAPTFGLVAGALLALRALPAATRVAERLVTRGRGAVAALAVWQLARRPHRFTRTTLLLIMATSVGVFAAAYERTWTASQESRAEHEVVADARLSPNRRTGDSITALQLSTALETVDGVGRSMAVVEMESDLPGADGPGRLVALDAEAAEILNVDRGESDLFAGLAILAAARPEIPGIGVPGDPTSLHFQTDVFLVDDEGQRLEPDPAAPPVPPLAGVLTLSILDGDGLFHRVKSGSFGFGVTDRGVALTVPSAGAGAVPRPPLRIIDVELETVTHGPISRRVRVEIGPLTTVDAGGGTTETSLVDDPWTASTEVLGFLTNPAGITLASSPAEERLVLTVTSGSTLLTVPVIHTVARPDVPPADTVPGLAGRAWALSAGVEVGDVIHVPTDRIDGLQVEIVGHVDVVPGVESDEQAAVLLDLPSMHWHERTPGSPYRDISEYWLDFEPNPTGIVDALLRSPIEAVDVISLTERFGELTSNPPALGSLGALGVGFIASLVFAIAALVVTAVVSARERRAELAVLEALGLAARQRSRWLLQEQVATVVIGVSVGAGVGLGLSLLVLPVMSLSADGSASYPPVVVLIPWMRVVTLSLAVAAASLAGVAASLVAGFGTSTATALRAGVES